jgi:integrase family protein with SAM-like domain
VAAAIDEFVVAAEAGRALNRSGRPYRPTAMRDVRGILEYHVAPDVGAVALRDVRRSDIQRLVDRLGDEGLSESRIRSVVSALRALYGYAVEQGYAEFNPADGLVMPGAGNDARERTNRFTPPLGDPPKWEEEPEWREPERREPERRAERRERDYKPIAVLPDRLLSYAMRAVFVLFALVALITILQSV